MGACVSKIDPIEVVERPQIEVVDLLSESNTRLQLVDVSKVPRVPHQGEIIPARIVDIYDGDTMKVIVMLGDVPFYISLRILGVDAPEIKKSADKLPEEHLAAVVVRDYMKSLLPDEIAKVRFQDWDKYGGRILGDLFTPEGHNVADILIAGGWVRKYHGEKKSKWTLEDLTKAPFV